MSSFDVSLKELAFVAFDKDNAEDGTPEEEEEEEDPRFTQPPLRGTPLYEKFLAASKEDLVVLKQRKKFYQSKKESVQKEFADILEEKTTLEEGIKTRLAERETLKKKLAENGNLIKAAFGSLEEKRVLVKKRTDEMKELYEDYKVGECAMTEDSPMDIWGPKSNVSLGDIQHDLEFPQADRWDRWKKEMTKTSLGSLKRCGFAKHPDNRGYIHPSEQTKKFNIVLQEIDNGLRKENAVEMMKRLWSMTGYNSESEKNKNKDTPVPTFVATPVATPVAAVENMTDEEFHKFYEFVQRERAKRQRSTEEAGSEIDDDENELNLSRKHIKRTVVNL